jgi:sulfur carrier protein
MAEALIWLNGEKINYPVELLLPELLMQLGYRPQVVVVELNGELLPRAQWSQQIIRPYDNLEVVTIVGGG